VISEDVLFPTCWLQYGECLDENQPPLDVSAKVKPLNNENVIKIEQDILTIEDCSRKCEESDLCEFYTLYGNDKNRNCQLVGFNLGYACNYLVNTCVLQKSCNTFNTSCDKGCVTGRRLIKDQTKEYRTLIVGGVKAKRLSFSEYETSIEVLNTLGESKCPLYLDKTEAREGAAGAFFEGTLPTDDQKALLCGGWFTTDAANSKPKQSFIKGEYYKSCEVMNKGQVWDKTNTIDMVRHRAFFSMTATDKGIYAFGGYNNYKGFLDDIEYIDLTADSPLWVARTQKLKEPKSHTCSATVNFKSKNFILVVGGWNDKLEYVKDVEIFNVNDDGSLSLNTTVEIPADRDDDPDRSKGRGDTACMSLRRNNWEDGLLVTGGYREAGAWLNTAWWLNLTDVFNPGDVPMPWNRVTNIAVTFDGGRHNHALTIAGLDPIIVGGWNNKALDTILSLNECEEDDDATRFGIWTQSKSRLKIGREKFVTLSVPKSFLENSDFCVDN